MRSPLWAEWIRRFRQIWLHLGDCTELNDINSFSILKASTALEKLDFNVSITAKSGCCLVRENENIDFRVKYCVTSYQDKRGHTLR